MVRNRYQEASEQVSVEQVLILTSRHNKETQSTTIQSIIVPIVPSTMARIPHPLSQLSLEETALARDVIRQSHPDTLLNFRVIFLLEPPKAEVEAYLELEHSGKLNASSQRPARLAQAWYDVIGSSRVPQYHETVVDLRTANITEKKVIDATSQASLSM